MGLSCGMKCAKYLLFVFNFIFWVAGIAVLGVGIWSRIESKDWDSLLGDDGTIVNASNLMIAAGAFVMVIGFFGCCGALKENRFLLVLYAIFLILIFILEIAAGIYAYTKKDNVINELEKNFGKAIKNSYGGTTDSDKSLTAGVDWFQENVNCCGAETVGEWGSSAWYAKQKEGKTLIEKRAIVPTSCCVNKGDQCNYALDGLYGQLKLHSKGCVKEGQQYLKDHLWQIGGVGIGIAFIQLFGIVTAFCLCRAISSEGEMA